MGQNLNNNIQLVNPRNKNNHAIHALRLHKLQLFNGAIYVHFYNKLPDSIRDIPVNKFKKCLKQHYQL